MFKFFSKNSCFFCDKKVDKTKSHKNRIASSRHQVDFIHENLMSFFFVRDYNDVFYVTVWMNDKIKIFHVDILFNKKNFEILISFKGFLNRIKHDMNKCIRIRMNNEREYFNDDFINYINEKSIRLKFIIVENSQMNETVERLNQTFIRKTNIFFKNNDLHFKWWLELINAVNHLRNICSVKNLINNNKKSITSYETFTNHSYNYNFFRRINQKDEYQIIKFSTSYKKFDDYKVSNVLINYKNEHIYRVIIKAKKFKRCFNVEWYDSFSKMSFQNSQSSSQALKSFQAFQSTQSLFEINQIDQFLNALFSEMNDERLKFNSTFKQLASRTTQNLIVIISQVRDKNQYITYFIFSINNSIFSISNFSTLSNNLSLSSSSNADIFTSILNRRASHRFYFTRN